MKHKCYLQTPTGIICIEENGEAVTALYFERNYRMQPAGEPCENGEECGGTEEGRKSAAENPGKSVAAGFLEEPETALLREAGSQLLEYFQGKRKEFVLPLSPNGTKFQQKVWQALCTIPYGETRSYGQIAAQIGQPKASRAVGGANNRNPIMIFIPCHRVIGADGSLTGFGGGLEAKKYLLELEAGKEISGGCSLPGRKV